MFKSNSINSVLSNEKYTGVYIFNKSAKKMPLEKETVIYKKILAK
ncbi:recombinase family protein [Clostridium yunnanense]